MFVYMLETQHTLLAVYLLHLPRFVTLPESVRFQAMRVVCFCVDKDSTSAQLVLNQITRLKDIAEKDKRCYLLTWGRTSVRLIEFNIGRRFDCTFILRMVS
jgi:hypothetical protein